MDEALSAAADVYDRLWRQAPAILLSGGVRVDPLLRDVAGDPRRGATLVARPTVKVLERVGTFLEAAAAVCPEQYFYQPADLHVTVLSVIPGSPAWRAGIQRLPACRTALEGVLSQQSAFSLKFRGVTVSPEAVLIQGFPQDATLARLRDDVRRALCARGLGDDWDRRYKITAAHLTVMRFSRPDADWRGLFKFLQANRQTDFGEMRVGSLQLIWSDWCATQTCTRVLGEYGLRE